MAKVNYLNILLMVLSLGLAFILPFELFLFSYAVLGPAHYLTEISWLHDRDYFSPRKNDYLWMVGLSLAVFMGSHYVLGDRLVIDLFSGINAELTFGAFGIALVLIITKNYFVRLIGILVLLTAIWLFRSERWTYLIFAVYLPTLIHVYVFTGAFILQGALKSHSASGYASFVIFLSCAVACFFITPGWSYPVSDYVRQSYNHFAHISMHMIIDFKLGGIVGRDDVYFSEAGQMVMRFIAFAYTYHYLNWFSKTSVIKWHEIPRSRYIAICLLWLASVGIYLYDYSLGLRWLFLLSFAHVLLEFPLNHRSFIGIGLSLRERLNGGQILRA